MHLAARDPQSAVGAGLRARSATQDLRGPWDRIREERLARAYLARGDAALALDAAERAVDAVLRDSGGLPDLLGARYRTEQGDAFAVGVEAAARTGDVERLLRIAEKARAVALRARLSAEEILDRTLEPPLRDEMRRIDEEEAAAVAAYRAVLPGGEPVSVRRAFGDLDAVRERAERLRERIRTP